MLRVYEYFEQNYGYVDIKSIPRAAILEYLERVWNMADQKFGFKSLPCAFALVETANVYSLKSELTSAI